MLSCASTQSRNFTFGKLIGEGMPVAEALARPDIIVEGVHTARAIPRLAQAMAVDLPICAAVANVLHEGSDIDREMANLLSRPLREEGLRH
jgi:glycerol-3-phosphate dehydrogenase (NAD(P)+)